MFTTLRRSCLQFVFFHFFPSFIFFNMAAKLQRGTYYYHLNIKEIDHIVFITKIVHVMFHETASRKLLVFTFHVNPYMSNRVSHFNLLDELIT